MNRRLVVRWLKVFIILYCLIGIIVYSVQDYLILLPTPLPANYSYDFDDPFKEVNLRYDDKSNINIIQFQSADTVTKGVVLYFHGNRKNISRYRRFFDEHCKGAATAITGRTFQLRVQRAKP